MELIPYLFSEIMARHHSETSIVDLASSRRIKFSIRTKLIAILAASVLLGVGLYLVVALNLFQQDKNRYLFSTSLATVDTARVQLEDFFTANDKELSVYYELLSTRDFSPIPIAHAQSMASLGLIPSFKAALSLEEMTSELIRRDLKAKKREVLTQSLLQSLVNVKTRAEATPIARRYLAELLNDSTSLRGKTIYYAGYIALELAMFHDALTLLNRFIGENPSSNLRSQARFLMGEGLFRQGRFLEAIEVYSKAELKGAWQANRFYKIGWSFYHLGDSDKAKSFWLDGFKLAKTRSLLRQAYIDALPWVLWGEAEVPLLAQQMGLNSAEQSQMRTRTAIIKRSKPEGDSEVEKIESNLLKKLFLSDRRIIEFSVYDVTQGKSQIKRLISLKHPAAMDEMGVKAEILSGKDAILLSELPHEFTKPLTLTEQLTEHRMALTLIKPVAGKPHLIVARYLLDYVTTALTLNPAFTSYLVGPSGQLLFIPEVRYENYQTEREDRAFVAGLLTDRERSGVKTVAKSNGDKFFVAYGDLSFAGITVVSEISYKKAFQAGEELILKSIYFGGFFMCLAIIFGMRFAKTLTSPIETLFSATRKIAQGNFKTNVKIPVNDEIGILADSFNYMSKRIVALLEQEKDKVRLEEEMKVAKLVQESFFPPTKLAYGGLEVSSFYRPASECGGDWWGVIPAGDKTVILIGDATGHGVGSALITATAASARTLIKELGAKDPELLTSPTRILDLLNKAIFDAAQGKILMTFFVAVVDPVAGRITYGNASHNPPFLYRYQPRGPEKKDLKPLLEAQARRLGESRDTEFTEWSDPISQGDVLICFTDGIIEGINPGKEEYGNRKFIKTILKSVHESAETTKDTVVNGALEFYGSEPLHDDVTLVIARVTSSSTRLSQAS